MQEYPLELSLGERSIINDIDLLSAFVFPASGICL